MGLITLAELKNLETLEFMQCRLLTNKGFVPLKQLPRLKSIYISDSPLIQYDSLKREFSHCDLHGNVWLNPKDK